MVSNLFCLSCKLPGKMRNGQRMANEILMNYVAMANFVQVTLDKCERIAKTSLKLLVSPLVSY